MRARSFMRGLGGELAALGAGEAVDEPLLWGEALDEEEFGGALGLEVIDEGLFERVVVGLGLEGSSAAAASVAASPSRTHGKVGPPVWMVRIPRAYGLFANIFGIRDFTKDKTKNGDLELKSGEKLHFRYRVLIHAEGTEVAGIAKLYEAWSK